jgi:hypothetical protein
MSWRPTSHITALAMLLTALVTLRTGPAFAGSPSVLLASDASWDVFSGNPAVPGAVFLGNAEPVCLNPAVPARCPVGAVLYDNTTAAWTADLSTIPGAVWVWAPGVTGATTPADLVQLFFTKTLTLPAVPLSAFISLGADDFAEVLVNGAPVGATGSITDPALAAAASARLVTFDITSQLVAGDNRIVIQGSNGPATFASCGAGACNYQQNPAGVVFGGVISFDRPPVCDGAFAVPATAWPPNHKPITVTVNGVIDPDGDPVAITIDAIRQDEPVDSGSCSDASGVGTDQATVLVERDGQGDGRVYHIFFHAADPFGGVCTGEVTVCVPHDQGHGDDQGGDDQGDDDDQGHGGDDNGGACGDGGPLFDSVGSCSVPPPVQCVACDDGDPCTVDLCTPTGCVHSPLSCDDGVPCTIDACVAGACTHVPATGFEACRCEFEALPRPHEACGGVDLPGGLEKVLSAASRLVTQAPGQNDPRATRPMVRNALHRLGKASRLVQRARRKGTSTACVAELSSQIHDARAAARAWLTAR